MHLLLVRHGESVDNVARLYAGSRDSSLTNHGVLQAKRLGAHLAKRSSVIGPIVHIFASNLRRAYHTAEAMADAQRGLDLDPGGRKPDLKVSALPELREKDFGFAEGAKFTSMPASRTRGAVGPDPETTDAMMVRVNRFIEHSLTPLLELYASQHVTIAVVAHGIILSVLLRALETRFPAASPPAAPEPEGDSGVQEAATFWSNTGVLQVKMDCVTPGSQDAAAEKTSTPEKSASVLGPPSRGRQFSMTVQLVNNKDHLDGLKKTKGGIGNAQFDSRQRTMTSFFIPTAKKRKAEDDGR